MNEITGLIEQAKISGPEGTSASARLISLGAVAVLPVVEEIRRSPLDQVRVFSGILVRMRDPEAFPIIVSLLKDENPSVKLAAYEALGSLKDARALQPLLDSLSDPGNLEFTRGLAARTLGELGELRAREGLLQAARELVGAAAAVRGFAEVDRWTAEEADEDRLRLAIEIAVAMAKLGDQTMSPVVTSIVTGRQEAPEESIIRSAAVRALTYVVGPGVFPTLRAALRSSDPELRGEAVDPLRYLGVVEAVGELIKAVRDEYESIAGNAFASIYDITGEWPDGKHSTEDVEREELARWWTLRRRRFRPGICYRLGKPIQLSPIIELLGEPRQRGRVVTELRVITGHDFSDQRLDEAKKWCADNEKRFVAGRLYKFGYEQDVRRIF
jgi:HEAT repeat protein